MKKFLYAKKVLLLGFLTVIFFLGNVLPVQAATSGRQVKVLACSAVRITLSGTNSAGKATSYTFNKTSTNCSYVNVAGKYWKGNLTVSANYNVSSEHPYYKGQTVTVTVPGSYSTAYYGVTVPTPTTRQWIYWRARTWIIDAVPYNQSSRHDGYRQDCSGYVSYTWQLTQPGTSPSGLLAYAYKIPFDSLQTGDVLDNPSAHAIFFVSWIDKNAGTFVAYQEEYPGSGARQRNMALNKTTGKIMQGTYTYPGTYIAIRKNGL